MEVTSEKRHKGAQSSVIRFNAEATADRFASDTNNALPPPNLWTHAAIEGRCDKKPDCILYLSGRADTQQLNAM
jgi:hypothetical protein